MTLVDPERAYIGALLNLPLPRAADAAALVRIDDLGDPQLQVVLEATQQLVADGIAPDPAAVLAHIRADGTVTGPAAVETIALLLLELYQDVAIPMSAPLYARAVLDEAVRRRCLEAGDRIRQAVESCGLEGLVELVQREADAVLALYKHRAAL